jgi:hypothetical protein
MKILKKKLKNASFDTFQFGLFENSLFPEYDAA